MAKLPPPDARLIRLAPVLQEAIGRHRAGRFAEAAELYRRVLKKMPDHFDALYSFALMRMQEGAAQEALALVGKAVKAEPRAAPAHCLAGAILNTLGRSKEAIASYDRALAIAPNFAAAWNDRGNTLRLLQRPQDAIASYDRAIAAEPGAAQWHNNRGAALAELTRFAEAIASYDEALRLQPPFPEALNNRGAALLKLDRPEPAVADLDRAIALKPDYAEAFNNRGVALQDLNRHREALDAHRRALAIRPDGAEARHGAATALLALGEFDEGWRSYEARWSKADLAPFRRTFQSPLWLGDQPVEAKTVLLYAEQGFGDAIQFCRYAPKLAQRGAKVVIEAPRALVDLLGSLPGAPAIMGRGDKLPPFDLQCPLASLPLAFATRLDTIPADVPYLAADPERIAKWREGLPPSGRPRIALAWRGRPYPRDRSVPFAALAPLLSLPDVEFVSLQQELTEDEARALPAFASLRHVGPAIEDFADTAALIAGADAVVSIDTSVAHLAGALGKPLWLMLIYSADFRWLIGRADSPWYPTARLVRQARTGDWSDVVGRVAGALADSVARVSA
jgi:tetratricopeptide (TPR) repeat protein